MGELSPPRPWRPRIDGGHAPPSNGAMLSADQRPADLRFLAGVALPVLTLLNVLRDPAHAAIGAFLVWLAIALLEGFWPALAHSPETGRNNVILPWLMRLHVPLQAALLAAGVLAAARADWVTVLGLGYAVGFVTGAQGITFAHELGHRRRRVDRA